MNADDAAQIAELWLPTVGEELVSAEESDTPWEDIAVSVTGLPSQGRLRRVEGGWLLVIDLVEVAVGLTGLGIDVEEVNLEPKPAVPISAGTSP